MRSYQDYQGQSPLKPIACKSQVYLPNAFPGTPWLVFSESTGYGSSAKLMYKTNHHICIFLCTIKVRKQEKEQGK